MSVKTVGVAGLMALAGLALISVIAFNPFSTQASTHDMDEGQETQERLSADVETPSQVTRPDQLGQLQASDEDEEDSDNAEPYIGVAIFENEDGSVEVVRVQEDSPSDGVLMSGDVITAVDGATIDGTGDLVDAIAEAGSGATITLTIVRDGASQTVDVTVGERDTLSHSLRAYRSSKKYPSSEFSFPRLGKGKLGAFADLGGRVVHSRTVLENEDGSFSIYRAVAGTLSNIDTTAGAFTLSPRDGSDPIDYTITDDTKVMMNRNGDLGALNTDDDTLVIDVDGEVKMVHQGERPREGKHFFRGGKRFKFDGGGRWRDSSHMADLKAMIEKASEDIGVQPNDRM